MKKIIFCTLLVFLGMDVMASELNIDGKNLYIKHCALCHGQNAKKSPLLNVPTLAGRNATILARITRAYRDQDESHGTAHSINRVSQMMQEATSSLSNQQLGAISIYIESL